MCWATERVVPVPFRSGSIRDGMGYIEPVHGTERYHDLVPVYRYRFIPVHSGSVPVRSGPAICVVPFIPSRSVPVRPGSIPVYSGTGRNRASIPVVPVRFIPVPVNNPVKPSRSGSFRSGGPIPPRGLARPHYADSSKFAYVCEGECIAGLISPEDSNEEVVKIQKGDTIPITVGTVSWWYNAVDSKLTIIFLGESSDEYTPGKYCYFFLTGAAVQLSYVTKGSGRVVIVELSGQVYGELSGGEISIWEAASPSILEASLNMTPDLTESFKSKIANGSVIAPHSTA
ncbi:hypothetical protein KY290_002857 [Solanum tuberosum]|uniref:Cupin type-1 domain-containing protein n=1 Tax=Solanum tuberosum TaxID=4113 RepID=A0ABQ7WRA7_SOLTU|nr:hypothetical protein KY290_002857 [Solanum tuberosum]